MSTNLTPPEARDLRDLMERSLREAGPRQSFSPGAIALGRPLRRRRTVATSLAVAVLVGAGAVGTTALMGGRDPGSTPVAADGSEVPSASVSPSPVGQLADGWWSAPAEDLLATLQPLLPSGRSIVDAELDPPGSETVSIGFLTVAIDSAAGEPRDELQVWLFAPDSAMSAAPGEDRAKLPSTTDIVTCPEANADEKQPLQCHEITDADGRVLSLVESFTDGDWRHTSVKRITADGGVVQVTLTERAGDTSPSLSHEELRAIADSPSWTQWSPVG